MMQKIKNAFYKKFKTFFDATLQIIESKQLKA